MDVKVLSRSRQTLSRRLSDSSLVGNSMLVRLRSGTIGLLGVVTAVGLGLVMVLSQQGWPGVATGPLPPRPPARFVQHETIALPVALSDQSAHRGTPARSRSRRSKPATPDRAPAHAPHSVEPGLAGSHQAAEPTSQPAPAVHPHNAGTHEPSPPVTTPPPATTVAAAPPATEPAAAPPAESPSGPVVAGADPEDESSNYHGWHHGHYPSGSTPPWWGQDDIDDASSNDDNSMVDGDDSTGDDPADEYPCDHERLGWAGY
jgi:hypothetical protein